MGRGPNFCPNCNKDKEGVDTHFIPNYLTLRALN